MYKMHYDARQGSWDSSRLENVKQFVEVWIKVVALGLTMHYFALYIAKCTLCVLGYSLSYITTGLFLERVFARRPHPAHDQ